MADVSPIPDGMHTITPHLICEGAAAAIDFYKQAFGAVEQSRHDTPGGLLLHASIRIGDSVVFLADANPDWQASGPKTLGGTPVVIHLYVEDAEAVVAQAAEAGATVTMPVQDTFWGDRYGQVTDPFGHQWSIATHVRDVTEDEMIKAAQEMFA
jgi:uncharacterized glyoxalase superfamily protein PhnB